MDYSQVGQGSPFGGPAPAGRRRGLRGGPIDPARVHPARRRSSACRWPRSAAVIAACGRHGQSPSASGARRDERASAAPASAAHRPRPRPAARSVRHPAPRVGRPGRDAGPRRLRHHRPVVRVPVPPRTRRRPGRPRARPGRRVVAERRRHRLDVQAPRQREVAARRLAVHVGRRRGHDGAPRRGRQLRSQGRPRPRAARSPPTRTTVTFTLESARTATSRTSSRSTTPRRSSPRPTTRPARPPTRGRPGPAPGSCVTYNQQTGATFERNPDWWGGQTPLDGTELIFFDETGPMITAYQGDQVDAIVQFDVLTGAALFDDPNFTLDRHSRRPSIGRSGCGPTPASSPTSGSARRSP